MDNQQQWAEQQSRDILEQIEVAIQQHGGDNLTILLSRQYDSILSYVLSERNARVLYHEGHYMQRSNIIRLFGCAVLVDYYGTTDAFVIMAQPEQEPIPPGYGE